MPRKTQFGCQPPAHGIEIKGAMRANGRATLGFHFGITIQTDTGIGAHTNRKTRPERYIQHNRQIKLGSYELGFMQVYRSRLNNELAISLHQGIPARLSRTLKHKIVPGYFGAGN